MYYFKLILLISVLAISCSKKENENVGKDRLEGIANACFKYENASVHAKSNYGEKDYKIVGVGEASILDNLVLQAKLLQVDDEKTKAYDAVYNLVKGVRQITIYKEKFMDGIVREDLLFPQNYGDNTFLVPRERDATLSFIAFQNGPMNLAISKAGKDFTYNPGDRRNMFYKRYLSSQIPDNTDVVPYVLYLDPMYAIFRYISLPSLNVEGSSLTIKEIKNVSIVSGFQEFYGNVTISYDKISYKYTAPTSNRNLSTTVFNTAGQIEDIQQSNFNNTVFIPSGEDATADQKSLKIQATVTLSNNQAKTLTIDTQSPIINGYVYTIELTVKKVAGA